MQTIPGIFLGFVLVTLAAGAEPQIRFADRTEAAGLLKPLEGLMGHGGAWGDFDGDGWIDLFVGGFCDRPDREYLPAAGPVPSRLFKNEKGERFTAVQGTTAEFFGRTSGAVFADFDNKGSLDLYAANNAKATSAHKEEPQKSAQTLTNKFFRNEAGKLVDISAESGACPASLLTARNVGVFDFDGDGLLDLFVVEDRFRGGVPRSTLFKNQGGLKFADVTKESGLPENLFGLGLAVADLNGDNLPDFFLPHSNRLFISVPGRKYRECTELAEVFAWKPLDNEDWPCGAVFADLNRDGKLDLIVSLHHGPARNRVYLNETTDNDKPRFRDVTEQVGLGDSVPVRCPHVEVQDFDNDGWPDIFVSAAWADGDTITPLIYRHQGIINGLPKFVPPRKIAPPMVYFPAGPSGDYDRDGRLDLFLVNWFSGNHCRLLHNEAETRHWLDVSVTGKSFNRQGIGSQIRIYVAGKNTEPKHLLGYQQISTGYGYASGQPAVCHFGLGENSTVDVEIMFPNGKKRVVEAVGDKLLNVSE